jgi:hypothetical protein
MNGAVLPVLAMYVVAAEEQVFISDVYFFLSLSIVIMFHRVLNRIN